MCCRPDLRRHMVNSTRRALVAAAFALLCRPAAAYDVITDTTNRSITPDMHALRTEWWASVDT